MAAELTRLWRYGLVLSGNRDTAEELVQATCVRALERSHQFEAGTRARYLTWLPKLWPPNARLIATTIAGTESEALDERAGMERANTHMDVCAFLARIDKDGAL